MYKHSENTIDPRDKHLISYVTKSKRFVTDASDLKANGIEPIQHHFAIGGPKWIIYLWSEKYKMHICYKHQRSVKTYDGDIFSDIFVPYFGIISTDKELKAHSSSLGTELHIIND